ncbi:MAG: hypothetical protein MHM6MM_004837 [Cercozoa sp. M6MM]
MSSTNSGSQVARELFDSCAQELMRENVGHFDKPACGRVIEIASDASVRQALELLSQHGILSAPVRDVSVQQGTWIQKYMGLLDMYDIVDFTLSVADQEGTTPWHDAFARYTVAQLMQQKSRKWLQQGDQVFAPVASDTSLFDAFVLMSKYRLHRLCVIDENDELSNIITQSAVVAKLPDLMSLLPEITLEQVGLGKPKTVFAVKSSQKVLAAFQELYLRRVGGIAVLGDNGELIGNISARDLRSVIGDKAKYPRLFDTVASFCARAPATVTPQDTLLTVVQRMIDHKVHRLYLVDADNKPCGVVSLGDVVALLVPEHMQVRSDNEMDTTDE